MIDWIQGTEIPEDKLPEPFNQQKHDLQLNNVKQSNSCSHMQNCSGVVVEQQTAQASHISPSFRKHFSKRGSDNESRNDSQTPLESLHQLPSISDFSPSADSYEMESVALIPEMVPYRPPEGQITCKPLVDVEFCSIKTAQEKQGTPTKSAATPIKPVTPILHTPKRVKSSRDKSSVSLACKASDRPSCARSLQFEGTSKNAHIELQVDDAECSDVNDILSDNLLQSLMEKEQRIVELAKRKQMTKSLPKLFDRIYFLYQNPKSSAIRKGALIRYLTECHLDITDESEVEEQLKLLQEIIPEWIICKLSPSGNELYSINKALNPNTLRLTLNDAM